MKELEIYADRIARAVGGLKTCVPNGQKTQIYIENSDEFIVAFFACLALDLKPLVLGDACAQDGLFLIDDLDKILGESSDFDVSDDAKFYLLTSGSSGVPKLIEKSVSQMLIEARTLALQFDFGDKFIASVSHQHMFGLTFKIFLPLVLGAKIEPKFLNYPEFIYEQDLRDVTLISSPTLLKALLESQKYELLKELKNVICAGARLDEGLSKKLVALTPYINIYGSTETGVVAADIGDGLYAINGVSVILSDSQTLSVSSAWCENFTTSDLARIDNGKISLLGRADRVVKINEKRISLDMCESAIKECDLIDDCVCGVQNGRIGAVLSLSALGKQKFRSDGKKGVTDPLKTSLKSRFHNNIRYFKIVSKIPRSSQGKLAKGAFDEILAGRESLKFEKISSDETSAHFCTDVSEGLFYFDGHFVDFPLVPGFVQLEAVVNLATQLGIDVASSKKFEAIKFSGFLRPGDKMSVALEIKNQKLYFQVANQNKLTASGRICLS